MLPRIRPAAESDLDALYAIALATADAGADAGPLYADPKLIGHVYMAGYVLLQPDWCFVAEDENGVAGYVVGTPDTLGFAQRLEAAWWPALRRRYPDPGPAPHATQDEVRQYQIHHPSLPPATVTARFPGHLHMNLLPRLQGQGIGRKLFALSREKAEAAGIAGIHVGVSPDNAGGAAFWQACGMKPVAGPGESSHPALWFGVEL